MPELNHESLFTNWLEEHSASVVKIARAYTRTKDECLDLTQEILLHAWSSVPNFQGKSSPATWFYRVALQTAMNWKQKAGRTRRKQRQLLEVEAIADFKSDGATQASHRESIERLYQAIHRLPKSDAALVLLYLEELSYREIADVLGITPNNVGVKLNRAKKALCTLMSEERDDS